MADKIVQLIDKDGNNIFPVATMPMTNYSTVEQDTGITWIDGKTIYKKTISVGNLPNASSKTVAHGISNIATIVNLEGGATTDAGSFMPFNITRPDGATLGIGAYATVNNILIYTGTDRSGMTGYVTLYYTKSS